VANVFHDGWLLTGELNPMVPSASAALCVSFA
jgi:hypothetical protein